MLFANLVFLALAGYAVGLTSEVDGLIGELDRPPVTPNSTFADRTKPKHNKRSEKVTDMPGVTIPVASDDNSTLRIFHYEAGKLSYTLGDSSDKPIVLIQTRGKVSATSVDYNSHRGVLHWTNSRRGFWTSNAAISSLPWDFRYTCMNVEDPNKDLSKEVPRFVNKFSGLGVKKNACKHSKSGYNIYNKPRGIKVIREEENWNPRSIAEDYITDKIYAADTKGRNVFAISLSGHNKIVLFHDDALIPMEVAVDPPEGLMFVMAINLWIGKMQIYRANMDGTSRQLIVEDAGIVDVPELRDILGFSLDTLSKRIYYGNFEKQMIESVDYKGEGRVVAVANVTYPRSVNAHNGSLYWSDAITIPQLPNICKQRSKCVLQRCDLNASCGACINATIRNSTHENHKSLGVHHFVGIKAIDPRLQPQMPNPCWISNGGCKQLCLLRPPVETGQGPQTTCACMEGYKLEEDGRSCSRILQTTQVYEDFLMPDNASYTDYHRLPSDNVFPISRTLFMRLLFEKPDRIWHHHLFHFFTVNRDSSELLELYSPPEDSMTGLRPVDTVLSFIEYILGNKSSKPRRRVHTLRMYKNQTLARTLAYDWVSRSLYWVVTEPGADEGDLRVFRYAAEHRQRRLLDYQPKVDALLGKIPKPVFMTVHPYRGYLFAALGNGSVVRLHSDGTNLTLLPNIKNAYLLAIDLNDDKLIWLNKQNYVSYANLDGSEPKLNLFKAYSESTDVMHVYDSWIYLKAKENDRIWRFDKLTGADAGSMEHSHLDLLKNSVGFKVSAKDARYPLAEDHPCVFNNGGCKDPTSVCIGVPDEERKKLKTVCKCEGEKDMEDETKCNLNSDGYDSDDDDDDDDFSSDDDHHDDSDDEN